MKEEFTIKNIVDALGIPRERFKEWVYRGFIKPSIEQADGVGTKNIYSRTDVYGVALLDGLIQNGFKREVAKRCVRLLLSQTKHERKKYLVFRIVNKEGEGVPYISLESWDDDSVYDFLKFDEWSYIHIVKFEEIRNKVDKTLKKQE